MDQSDYDLNPISHPEEDCRYSVGVDSSKIIREKVGEEEEDFVCKNIRQDKNTNKDIDNSEYRQQSDNSGSKSSCLNFSSWCCCFVSRNSNNSTKNNRNTNNNNNYLKSSRRRKLIMTSSILLLFVVLAGTIIPCALYITEDYGKYKVPIRVGAFNIKHFGRSLMKKQDVVFNLLTIFERYDVILVQEVRDSSNTAVNDLKERLNTRDEMWEYVSSEPIGRSKIYKEQYVFFYKPKTVKVVRKFQINDIVEDIYEREPFGVIIEYKSVSNQNAKERVVLLGLHAKPRHVERELNELAITIKEISKTSYVKNTLGVIALGDFNADCRYLSHRAKKRLELFVNPDFEMLIPDTVDTTVSKNTDCSYDRVVIYSNKNRKGGEDSCRIDARQGTVFNYEIELRLKEEEAARVSDHYPVEFLLY